MGWECNSHFIHVVTATGHRARLDIRQRTSETTKQLPCGRLRSPILLLDSHIIWKMRLTAIRVEQGKCESIQIIYII